MKERQVTVPQPYRPGPSRKRHYGWLAILIIVGSLAWWYRDKITNIGDINIVTPLTKKENVLGGKIVKITPVASWSTAEVDRQSRQVYTHGALEPSRYSVEQFNITYTSTDPRTNRQIEVTGRVYLPLTGSKRPLIAFGPGTTGVGPLCAPSLEVSRAKNWGRYDKLLSFYAGQGYAVASTDYANRKGENAISPYFIGESEGRVMLDMVRAMQVFKYNSKFRTSPVGEEIYFSGYSQGGHAALWAEKIRPEYAKDIESDGIVLFAPATDLHKTFYDTAYGATTVWLPAYLYAAYNDYYGIKTPTAAVFKEPFASTLAEDARRYCIDDVEPSITGKKHFGTNASINKLYQANFMEAMRNRDIALAAPEFSRLMAQNLAGEPVDIPVLIISGRRDAVIFASAQTELAKRICADGTSNLQLEFNNDTHYTGNFSLGRGKVLSWLEQVSRGGIPKSQCSIYQK